MKPKVLTYRVEEYSTSEVDINKNSLAQLLLWHNFHASNNNPDINANYLIKDSNDILDTWKLPYEGIKNLISILPTLSDDFISMYKLGSKEEIKNILEFLRCNASRQYNYIEINW